MISHDVTLLHPVLPCILVSNLIFFTNFCDGLQSVLGLAGDIGGDFYFVLQGSVAIKIDNEVIKVCCSEVYIWSFNVFLRLLKT